MHPTTRFATYCSRVVRLAAAAAFCAASISAQQVDTAFGSRAKAHVEALAALGPRMPGTPADRKAETYIADCMRRAGLRVAVEDFEFDSFRLAGAELSVNGSSEKIDRVIFDPYSGPLQMTGQPLFLGPDDLQPTDEFVESAKGKILIASRKARAFDLTFGGPKAAAVVSQPVFDRLKALAPAEVTVRVEGRLERVRTANVVGTTDAGSGPFVAFTAHRDSVETAPGADDNASGIGVLLELARTWVSAPARRPARFIALAAEELGLVGAKAYITRHRDELTRCKLVLNLDTIGSSDDEQWLDADGGVEGVEPDWAPSLRADVGPDGTWILAQPFRPASNVPAWLRDAITASAKEIGIRVALGRFSGSDHLAFARAGVPATHLAASTGKAHSNDDVAANVSEQALLRAGRLAAAIARKVN